MLNNGWFVVITTGGGEIVLNVTIYLSKALHTRCEPKISVPYLRYTLH